MISDQEILRWKVKFTRHMHTISVCRRGLNRRVLYTRATWSKYEPVHHLLREISPFLQPLNCPLTPPYFTSARHCHSRKSEAIGDRSLPYRIPIEPLMNNPADSASDYGQLLKDIRVTSQRKMGLSERSKTFTIENLLKSDPGAHSPKSASSPSGLVVTSSSPSIVSSVFPCADLLTRLDFAARQQEPQFLNWLRLQSPSSPGGSAAPAATQYLLSGLPGKLVGTRRPGHG